MGAQTSRVPLPDHSIQWYRTPLDSEVNKQLHTTSDLQGSLQTFGFLGNLALSAWLALTCQANGWAWCSVVFTILYGMQANFLINGMHELGHGHVFRTKALNNISLRIISFLGWLHPDMFFSSHLRHHRYTQNEPYDQEAPMPVIPTVYDFLGFAFINVKGFLEIFDQTVRAAIGKYPTGHLGWRPGWEDICYPPNKPEARDPATLWARIVIVGHLGVFLWSVATGNYLVSILINFGPFYAGGLFWLCNSSQHIGLPHGTAADPIVDFRIIARSFHLDNAIVRMWYWHMNWHIEHHMYAAVPCYNLAALHEHIKHDLPPTPNGLAEMWLLIRRVVAKQAVDPNYVQQVLLPESKSKSS